jgi:hypothetical protein
MTSSVLLIDWRAPPPSDDVRLDTLTHVTGKARTTDQRALARATVEAVPMHCPSLTDGQGMIVPGDFSSCLPRAMSRRVVDGGSAQVTTDTEGSFSLDLDPGVYLVRVEPSLGTRLPWVTQSVVVPTPSALRFEIPAPVYRGMVLSDTVGNPITNAIVKMFTVPDSASATEVGEAITDATGRFDMYIDPSVQ